MTGQRYSPEFKDEAVRQVLERGYSVYEVAAVAMLMLIWIYVG